MTVKGPYGFAKGLNTMGSFYTIDQYQYADAQNVGILFGDIIKRKGSVALAGAFASTPAVTGVSGWKSNAGQQYLIAVAGTKIYKMEDMDGTFDDVTGAVTITTGQDNQSTFASLNNIFVRCGGATPDAPIKWTGTGNAAALGGTPPSGNICTVANNFMFISGITATPSRVQWSNVGDPETWSATNYVDFRKDDGDRVTAIAPQDQNLIIYKNRSIGKLYTNSLSTTLGPLSQSVIGVGCAGPNAVDVLPDGRHIFLGSDSHVYIYDGNFVEDISNPPFPNSSVQNQLDVLAYGRLSKAFVRVYTILGEVWISASTSGSSTNNKIFVYNYIYGCWSSFHTGIAANCMCTLPDTRGTPKNFYALITGNYGGIVYSQNDGFSNAEDTNGMIDSYVTISAILGVGNRDFIPRSALVPVEYFGNYPIDFNWGFNTYSTVSYTKSIPFPSVGVGLDSFILDTDMLSASSFVLRNIVTIENSAQCSSIQIQLRNNQAAQRFQIHPIYISDEILI